MELTLNLDISLQLKRDLTNLTSVQRDTAWLPVTEAVASASSAVGVVLSWEPAAFSSASRWLTLQVKVCSAAALRERLDLAFDALVPKPPLNQDRTACLFLLPPEENTVPEAEDLLAALRNSLQSAAGLPLPFANCFVDVRAWGTAAKASNNASNQNTNHIMRPARSRATDRVPTPVQPTLRQFLDAGGIRAAHHGIFPVGSEVPDRYECLARFQGPDGRVLTAGQVLDGSETAADLAELDLRVLQHAVGELKARPSLALSVNVSRTSLGRKNWRAQALNLLRCARPASLRRLALEITEVAPDPAVRGNASAALVKPNLSDNIRDFQATGVAVWLDDLGSGVASLSEAVAGDVNGFKSDRSLLRHVVAHTDSFGAMAGLSRLAASWGLTFVAEGAENAAERALAEAAGASHVQGFFAGLPRLASRV